MSHTEQVLTQLDLLYPWNTQNPDQLCCDKNLIANLQQVEFWDETLRDGLQSPSVKTPSLDEKIKILHYINDIGIHSADIGFPAAGKSAQFDVLHLAVEALYNKMPLQLACAARTVVSDIMPIAEISQRIGANIEVAVFIGSSTIRRYVENWDLDFMLQSTRESVKFCTDNNLKVLYVTEDTTRADPKIIETLYLAAIESGAQRICLCDTVGYSTPSGVSHLVRFVKNFLKDSNNEIKIDWHGHNDRGLGLVNSLTAIKEGVNRIHGTCLGIGERSGNTAIDHLLINLQLFGKESINLKFLYEYCQYVSQACSTNIPSNYPVIGGDAFRTSTGVHAAAVIKALRDKKDEWLADHVYSAVPASILGLKQKIDIGPISGKSNISFWLGQHGIEITNNKIEVIFEYAKKSNHILTDDEIFTLIGNMPAQ